MKLAIYGAGGLGREVLELAQTINARQARWDAFLFVDDIAPDRVVSQIDVIDFASVCCLTAVEIVIAVGEPALRSTLLNKIRSAGLPLATLIHPDVLIPASTSLGQGVVICKHVSVSCDAIIHDNVFLQPLTCIGHDVDIGENSIISPGVMLGGGCKTGKQVFIGMNAAVKEKIQIGCDAIISMGAAVFTDIQDEVIAIGNPARVIRRNKDKKVF